MGSCRRGAGLDLDLQLPIDVGGGAWYVTTCKRRANDVLHAIVSDELLTSNRVSCAEGHFGFGQLLV